MPRISSKLARCSANSSWYSAAHPVELHDYDRMPPVAVAMTPFPHAVQVRDPVVRVEALFRDHEIRHIPVLDGDDVVGVISQRDVYHLVNPALPRVDKARIRARDILTPNPYVVELNAPLGEVVAEMGGRRLGCAIVVKDGKLAGILSVTDVCRILAEVLEVRFGGGGDAA